MLEQNGLAIMQRNYGIPAALNLSFAGSEISSSLITFTRASGATRFRRDGALEVVGNDVARIDYDPANVIAQNLVPNSSWEDATIGSNYCPGLAIGSASGVGWSIVNKGVFADGTPYVDARCSGTATGTGYPSIGFSPQASTAPGKQLISAAVIQMVAGTVPAAGVILQSMGTLEAGGYISSAQVDIKPTMVTRNAVLVITPVQTHTAGTVKRGANIQCNVLNGQVIDFTLRISKWQCNDGSALLPYTPTYGIPITICEPKGLLIEESRTNLFIQSEDFTQAAWAKTDITVAKTQTGLSGITNSACLITEGSAGTAGLAQGSGIVAAGATCSYSAVIRKNAINDWIRIACASPGGNGYQAWFNISTGALGTTGVLGTGTGSASITNLGNGYYACCVTATIGGADTACNSNLYSTTANAVTTRVAGATYTISHAQIEQGAFPTSYIPTTTAAVTRAADSAVMTGANFSSWYNQTQGTFVVSAVWDSPPGPAAPQLVLQIDNATSAERTYLRRNTGGVSNFDSVVASVFQGLINPTPNTITTGVVVKSGIAYSAAATSTALNTSALGVSGAKLLPAVTQLSLGSALGGAYLNGHIRSITYYNTKLTDAKLQALTA